jgi:hypothetical protein
MTTRFPVPKSAEYLSQLEQRGCNYQPYYGTTSPGFYDCESRYYPVLSGVPNEITPDQVTVTEEVFEGSGVVNSLIGWVQEHPILSLGIAVTTVYFLSSKKGRMKNPIELVQYEPHHYSVWETQDSEYEPGFLEQWKDEYLGEVYDDEGLWVGRRTNGTTDIFPTKQKAIAWVKERY